MSDWTVLPIVVLGLIGLVGLGEGLRSLGLEAPHTRRFVHSGVGLAAAGLPLVFRRPLPVYVLALLFVGVNVVAKRAHWWPSIHEARPQSWGTVTMPMALTVGVAGTWSVTPDRIVILQAAFLVLAVSDPLAAWAGQRYDTSQLRPGTTWGGSGVFFLSAAGVVGGVLLGVAEWDLHRTVGASLLVAGAATAVEGISRGGLDNLCIVLPVLLVLVPLQEGTATVSELFGAGVAGVAFGGVAYTMQILTGSGAVGGGLFGATLVGVGGTVWVVPALTFFGLSSVLSFLPPEKNPEEHGEGKEKRTLRQVLANGGVAWSLLIVAAVAPTTVTTLQTACYLGFLGALAAAAADTWATELGTRYAGRPWSLRTLQRVAPGTSGAVSVLGTGGALLGAGSIAGAAYVTGFPGMNAVIAVQVIGAGIVGMSTDSFLGATIERRGSASSQKTVEESGDTGASWGWAGVDNDVVNLCGTTTGAIVAAGTVFLG